MTTNQTAPKRYHPVHVTLHWLVALLTFVLLFGGLFVFPRVPNAEEAPLLGFHKMAGIFLGLFMIARLITRYVFKRPAPADAGHPVLNVIGKIVHFLLYVGVFTMMFTGDSLDEAYGLEGILKGNGETIPENLFIYPERLLHGNIGYVMIALIVLHTGAALYHQFIRKDNLIGRMWFGK
jgi:cytochrome b561